MPKRHAFLLVGPVLPQADELVEELTRRKEQLDEATLAVPAATQADVFRSGLEILRTHKAEGLRRKDVEGSWARVCRKAEKAKADVLLGNPSYVGADAQQIALLLDGLAGFRTNIVITAPRGTVGLDDLIDEWAAQVKPSKLHVLTLTADEDLDTLLGRVVDLARDVRTADLEKRITKLKQKRSELKDRLEQIRAS